MNPWPKKKDTNLLCHRILRKKGLQIGTVESVTRNQQKECPVKVSSESMISEKHKHRKSFVLIFMQLCTLACTHTHTSFYSYCLTVMIKSVLKGTLQINPCTNFKCCYRNFHLHQKTIQHNLGHLKYKINM